MIRLLAIITIKITHDMNKCRTITELYDRLSKANLDNIELAVRYYCNSTGDSYYQIINMIKQFCYEKRS